MGLIKPYFFFLILVFVATYCDAQCQRVVDSLEAVLANEAGLERYNALHKLAVEHVGADNERALAIITQAERVALLSEDSLAIVRSRRAKGQILFLLGRTRAVLANNDLAIGIARRNRFSGELIYLMNATAAAYTVHGKYDRALEYLFRAYETCKSVKSADKTAMVLENIGVLYYKLKDCTKALPYLTSAFSIKDSLNAVSSATPMNISLCYLGLGQLKNAQRYLNMSRKICGNNCDASGCMHIRYAQGCIFSEARELQKAEHEFRASYALAIELRDVRMQLDNIYRLGRICFDQDRIRDAAVLLSEGERLIGLGINNTPETIKIYKQFSELQLTLQNFKEAARYQSRYIVLRDSIYNEELTANLVKVESEFLQRDNRAKLTAQAQVILLKDEAIRHQKLLNVVGSCLTGVLLVFFIFLYRTYRHKQHLNLLLESRVRDRTAELEANRDALAKAAKERQLEMEKRSKALLQNVARIEVLSATAARESENRRIQSYLEKIIDTVISLRKVMGH